ncbi:hypothetical protein A3K86_18870 [Photobacterium jeanii]|uniref:VCBS repeat-containing protein n=1 Tax=Photobacterium jeanii TaxID=858640 RepID=A0A178K133_9GAMM|nr:FG-GAP-like repeat-containing protein [Photobacterium jeanii]OAN11039.1 hypothetical protein A3K86_18870 [Photobacterium jeanii]
MKPKKIGTWLVSLAVSAALAGCNGSASDQPTTNETPKAVINTQFAATYLQTLQSSQASGYALTKSANSQNPVLSAAKNASKEVSYKGTLRITNRNQPDDVKDYDWPITQKADGTVQSHRALSLKPGVYDLLLIVEDHKGHQYLAESLGQEIEDNEQPELEFVLKPNMGETITDLDFAHYVSYLNFSFTAEELASLVEPQFGLTINSDDERVFTINKETGLTEVVLNVQPGEYTMALKLYDGDLMVGKNENDTTLNIVEGSDAKMDVIPLQADVTIKLDELKDLGEFTFSVPSEIVKEVGDESQVALIVRMASSDNDELIHEQQLDVMSDNQGGYYAKGVFETKGYTDVTATMSFHHANEAAEQFNTVPYAKCASELDISLNQSSGCKLTLKREGVITSHIKGTMHLNVLTKDLQAASGASVYLNGELVGITGKSLSPGSLKVHVIGGEYQVKATKEKNVALETVTVKPLEVVNQALYLQRDPNLGTGNFVEQQVVSDYNHFGPNLVIAADFNGNGSKELLMSGSPGYRIGVMQEDGMYGFEDYKLGNYSNRYVDVGDINGDNALDFLVADSDDKGNVRVFINDKKGNFSQSSLVHEGTSIPTAKFADITGDGHLDIVLHATQIDEIIILSNDGQGQYLEVLPRLEGKTNASKPDLIAVHDMNGDGHLDIVYAGAGTYSDGIVYLNDGKGQFQQTVPLWDNEYMRSSSAVAVGDLNADGFPDVVVTDAASNRLFINNGASQLAFSENSQILGSGGASAILSDVNSDGHLDVLLMQDIPRASTLFQNEGNGHFLFQGELVDQSGFTTQSSLYTSDLDGDGDEDLVVLGHDNKVPFSVGARIYHNTPH